jgi:hypothetical protein
MYPETMETNNLGNENIPSLPEIVNINLIPVAFLIARSVLSGLYIVLKFLLDIYLDHKKVQNKAKNRFLE